MNTYDHLPRHFTFPPKKKIFTPWICLVLTGFLVLSMGCSLTRKDTGPQALIRTRMDFEEAAAAHEEKKEKKNHVGLARELLDKGYYEVALVQLKTAGEEQGYTAEIHHLMGVCYRETGALKNAEHHIEKAVSLDPDYAPAHNGLGLVYEMTGRRDQAREAFLMAVEKNPARPDFLNNLGFLEMRALRFKPAEACFKKSLRIFPENPAAINNLAICYGMQGREEEAFALLKKSSSPAAALNNMGVICRMKGDKKRAAALFERALQTEPGLVSARENLRRLKAEN